MAISLSVSTSLQNRSLSKFSTKSASSLKWNQFDKNNKIASRTTHKIDDNKLLVQFFVMHYTRCQSPKYENGFKHLWHLASGNIWKIIDEILRLFYSAKSFSHPV